KSKHQSAEHAKSKRCGQNCGVRSGRPHNLERHELAHRTNQQIRRPQSKYKSTHAAEQRQHKTFAEKLARDPPTAAAKRETDRDFLPPPCATRKQHVCEIEA